MMKKAIDIIKTIAERTDRVILFHSASGKDSIALLDLISPYFKEIVCVYMYVVKDLSHINRYINYACKKCYPLSEYKNKDVMDYISRAGLIKPESYDSKHQSSGTDITDINYLLFLRNRFPGDLQKVINEYPLVERKLFEYDYERTKAK